MLFYKIGTVVSVTMMIGFVGGLEHGRVGFLPAAICILALAAATALFGALTGWEEAKQREKNRHTTTMGTHGAASRS